MFPPDKDETFNDIAKAVHQLRRAFLKNGLTPPSSIELGAHEDGDRLRYSMPRDLMIPMVARDLDDKESAHIVFQLVGIEFRYPAKKRQVSRTKAEWL